MALWADIPLGRLVPCAVVAAESVDSFFAAEGPMLMTSCLAIVQ
jgi:hypothetical protein